MLAIAALIWLAELLGTFARLRGVDDDRRRAGARRPAAHWAPPAGSAAGPCGRAAGARAALAGRGLARRASPAPWSPPPGWCRRWAASPAAWTAPTRSGTTCRSRPGSPDGGHFGSIDYFDPIFFASFYPANSEVVHAVPLLAFDRDILSPLLNLGWLALGLARRLRASAARTASARRALIGGAIALGSQNLVEFQAGEALNDIVGVALILAAVAVLVNAWAAATATGDDGRRCRRLREHRGCDRAARSPGRGAGRRRARGRPGGRDQALVPGPRRRPVRRR